MRNNKNVSKILGPLVMALSLIVLFGWVIKEPTLVSLFPGLASMKVNTALSFFFLAASISLISRTKNTLYWRVPALLVLIVSLLTIIQTSFGQNFGLDEIFVRDFTSSATTNYPGRMSMPTAISFTLLASALLFNKTRFNEFQSVLSMIVFAISLSVFISYPFSLFDENSLYSYTGMALHTSILFLLLTITHLVEMPSNQWVDLLLSENYLGKTTRRLFWLVLLVPTIGGWLIFYGEAYGLYDPGFARSMFSAGQAAIFVFVLIYTAQELYKGDEERKMLQTSMVASQLFGVFNSAMDGIISLNKKNKIVLFNPAAEKLFGYTADEMIGQSIDRLLPAEFKASHSEHMRKFAQSALTSREMGHGREVNGLRSNGEEFPLEASISRIEMGDDIMLTVMLRDMTLPRQNIELVRAYARLLEQSNQELQEFAYVASHDLQEPLRVVSSYLQLLQRRYEGKLDEKADTFINFAVDASRRMQLLISGLLELSRIGTLGKELIPDSLDLPLQDALQNLGSSIEETNAVIQSQPLPTVVIDRSQIATLFQNLIGNSLKFTAENQPRIEITARQENEKWIIGIQDNGIGIDPEYYERIFTIFQRLHTREEYSGTGIGLAICKKIVERHGGDIWVESQNGKGTTFYFSLPDSQTTPISTPGLVDQEALGIYEMDESTLVKRAKELI